MNDILSNIVTNLPDSPGVYQFFDINGILIYIGKAKNLKKRVSSYFHQSAYESAKLRVLVSKICDIKFIVVDSESDALLLENILIKKHKPRYNVLLKDDKTYPWIVIKNEPFPRVYKTRKYIDDGSSYFGPYTSGRLVFELLDLIRKLYPVRTCSLNLTPANILAKKFKPCLEYHIGNCLAPCIGMQSHQSYLQNIDSIKRILQGNLSEIKNHLKAEMVKYSNQYKYEEAQLIKEKIDILTNFQSKTTIVNPKYKDIEVFTILTRHNIVGVNFIRINKGQVVQSYNLHLKSFVNESLPELFSSAIAEIRQRLKANSTRILVNIMPEFTINGVSFSVPQRGDRKKFVELSLRNLEIFLDDLYKNEAAKSPVLAVDSILTKIKDDLNLSDLPVHMECFDNSNIQGSNPVASCVVFKNAKPSKKDYRHYNIKTVQGPDDFASMKEVVYRRYSRMLSDGETLPQLIVIDGGKGQLNAAMESIVELGIQNRVHLIGIAKRLEEIFVPGDPVPVYLDKRSETLRIIQQIRNEAHRFGIKFHRNKRSNSAFESSLEQIEGIGPKTIQLLFTRYLSLDGIRNAPESELIDLIGTKRTNLIKNYFKKV
ncbi:MAG TPA: excinuclease ABC subunit UvrC [Tenuifilaceae bacterium]|nr:excinuclease ABC subunit UvrC [Tenuifilaceae bacterium]HOW19963.1 excinuclease ABC subunit UvrC [Tenuifilaceae bacterium]HQM04189.1 excinuclease ABC subunit UvrC [Tenuifilaceae bacterium]HRC93521.1 excinuclease ABC subunit UvrC [Tenuifilaceae bacterium]